SINITIVHNNVKYNAAGQVISAQVKNGKLESFFGYNANNFAWYNPANSKMELFMYAKNGQFFVRDLFIEDGSITNAKIGNVIQSNNYLNGRPSWIINKNGFAEFQNIKARGEIDATSGKLENVIIEKNCEIKGTLKV
ncbi:phage tail tip protein, partial [Klebsiella pneumoniae]|uniref:phage tail tip fiber protein n=1 Tax=Klebsiella pneumoniae TaxID=573 RepID=UPI001C0400B6